MDKKGFTLVELLIVVAIIAILSTIGLVIYSGAQKAGRTAKRIGDMKAVQTALELYYQSTGKYPEAAPLRTATGCGSWTQVSPNDVIPVLSPNYMHVIPTDPQMNGSGRSCYLYVAQNNGEDYKFIAHDIAEYSGKDYAAQPNFVDPARDGGSDSCKVDYNQANPGILAWAVYSNNTADCGPNDPRKW